MAVPQENTSTVAVSEQDGPKHTLRADVPFGGNGSVTQPAEMVPQAEVGGWEVDRKP